MANAKRDQNSITTLIAASNVDGTTPINIYADPVTHRLLVDATGSGTGSVTSVSVVSANGLAGTVATATTTPAITLSTSVTGVLKGNGTAISAATAGTDYTVGSTGLAGGQTVAGGTLTTQNLTLRANAADTTTGAVAITTSTASTTKTTGALTVAGGVGVAGAINANDLTVTNAITGSVSGSAATATTATNATNITLTDDDVSSSTSYPIFSGSATGNQGPKTDSAKLTYVANTGLLTSTSLVSRTSVTAGANGGTVGSVALNGNTSGTVTIQPAAVAGTWTLTLPATGGTNNYVLSTNGSGVTSWVAQTGGGGSNAFSWFIN